MPSREHLIREQQLDIEPGIAAGAVADRDVEIALGHVDDRVGRGDPHIDLGPLLVEPVQPQDQPFGGQGGRCGHGQSPGVVVRPQSPDRRLDAGKGLGKPGQQHSSRGGELDRPVHAVKQPDPEILLQGMDLMADRGRRDMELVGGLAEAHMAGRRFEGP